MFYTIQAYILKLCETLYVFKISYAILTTMHIVSCANRALKSFPLHLGTQPETGELDITSHRIVNGKTTKMLKDDNNSTLIFFTRLNCYQ